MIKKLLVVFAVIFLISALAFAEKPPKKGKIGGPCSYVEVPGTAKIVSIEKAGSDEYNCKDAVVVLFDFTPDDPNARDSYRIHYQPDTNIRLTAGAGINPSRKMVDKKSIRVGNVYRCIRSEIIKGTCTPLRFHCPDIDFSDVMDACW